MAVNSGQIDLNADAILFDREDETLGSIPSESVASVAVSGTETLTESIKDEVQVQNHEVLQVGDDGRANGSAEPLLGSDVGGFDKNPACDAMINDSEKVGFNQGTEFVDRANVIGVGTEHVDEGCDVKAIDFSNGLVKNENKKNTSERSNEAPVECGGTETDEDLVIELNDSVENEMESKNVKDHIPNMEVKDVSSKEFLHHRDLILGNHLCEFETSYDLKQPAFEIHGQAEAMQNCTTDIKITEAAPSKNIQNKFHGFNLVVDLNSYRNSREVDLDRKSASSELNLCVSDLVWGKVRGHPWWPGQIFDPSAASEKAKKHHKPDSYLIAYFGDQTFAWNDASKVKPFHIHFKQMEKQSNMDNFHHAIDCALDEVSRRVEFGLCCPCMPEEVLTKLKTQTITNAGIQEQSQRDEGDRFLNAISFEPMKLVNMVKSLAQSPLTEFNRLNFVIAHAQLLAFYRAKGYYQLPEFTVLDESNDNDMEILFMEEKEQYDDQIDGQGGPKTHLGFSQKRKHISMDSARPRKKHKCLSELMSEERFCVPNGEHALERKAGGNKLISGSSGRKRKAAEDAYNEHSHKSQSRKLIQSQCISIDEMWSQLCLAARNPTREGHESGGMLSFFSEFRSYIIPYGSASLEQGMSLEQMHAQETGVGLMEAVVSVTSAMEPSRDSYWTDRIIECVSEDHSLLMNQREEFPSFERSSPSFRPQETAEGHLDESSRKDFCPTALILNFTNLDSVPSKTNLNKIFGRFGPLIESQTELLKKSSRARVVFRRHSDAETAFSSAGKYSIFGPSLVSYSLKVMPSISTRVTGGKRNQGRKATSSANGAAA